MNLILYTVIVALCIAFVLGVLLGLFKKIFHVDEDERVLKVRDALSGGNCGGCGFAGCDSFAKAVVKEEAPVDGCVAGGSQCATRIAEILGKAGVEVKPHVAILHCAGCHGVAHDKGTYLGIQTCQGANLVCNGTKKCAFGCIGLGDCVRVCPFGALSMGSDGLPHVDYNKCTGCGKCSNTCPKHLFHIVDKDLKTPVPRCSSYSDNKPQIKKDCSAGCFKCGMCARKCPVQAIDLSTGIPNINKSLCTSCGACVDACPDKVLHFLNESVRKTASE